MKPEYIFIIVMILNITFIYLQFGNKTLSELEIPILTVSYTAINMCALGLLFISIL